MSKLNNIWRSLKLNYKSWLILIASNVILSWPNILHGFLEYAINTCILYYGHVISHWEIFYPFNYGHIYHHKNVNILSSIIQILIEIFAVMTLYIFIITIFGKNSLNAFTVLMFSIFYTTIHNINYSILHVNKVHEKHHNDVKYNYGPDIIDIIMDTKHDVENDLENTDHYIANILIATTIAYYAKKKYNLLNENSKTNVIYFLIMIYIIMLNILFFLTVYAFYITKKDVVEKIINGGLEDLFMEFMEERWKYIENYLLRKANIN